MSHLADEEWQSDGPLNVGNKKHLYCKSQCEVGLYRYDLSAILALLEDESRRVCPGCGYDFSVHFRTPRESLASTVESGNLHRSSREYRVTYPPAEPGALCCEPLEAAKRGR